MSLYVAAFQRKFVWDDSDVRDFFDSILEKYPIGTIILWQHTGYDHERDPFAEPLIFGIKTSLGARKYYILDERQKTYLVLCYYIMAEVLRDREDTLGQKFLQHFALLMRNLLRVEKWI